MVKEYKNKDSGFIGYTEMMSGSSHAIKTTTQPLLLWSYMRIALIAFYATFSISNTATTTLSSWHIDTESFLLYLLLNVVVWWMFFFFLFFFLTPNALNIFIAATMDSAVWPLNCLSSGVAFCKKKKKPPSSAQCPVKCSYDIESLSSIF